MRFWSITQISTFAAVLRVVGNIGLPESDADITITREQNLAAIRNELATCGDVSELNVFINSKGGDASIAFGICNTLKQHPAKKVAFIQGYCGSAATVIVMGCNEIQMDRAARFVIHEPQIIAIGGHTEVIQRAHAAQAEAEPLVRLYSEKTKNSLEEIRAAMAVSLNMSAAEAKAMRFVDKVVDLPAGMIPDDSGKDDVTQLLDSKCLKCAFAWAGTEKKS